MHAIRMFPAPFAIHFMEQVGVYLSCNVDSGMPRAPYELHCFVLNVDEALQARGQ